MINIAGLKRKTLCRAKEVDTQQREKEKAMKKAYLNNMGTSMISIVNGKAEVSLLAQE
jgi:hypothetical protein